MAAKRDYYEVLEVTRTSTGEEIKRSFRRLAVKFHPDKNPGDHAAEERFKEISEAYDILSDENKRAAYDNFGHGAFAGGGMDPRAAAAAAGIDPIEMIRQAFFGGGGGGRADREAKQRGADLRYDLQIRLEEAARGTEKEIEFSKLETCKQCEGSGAQDGSNAVTCRDCRGTGQISLGGGFVQFRQTCTRCRGTGQVIEHPCTKCGGDGRAKATSRIKLRIPPGIEDGSRLHSRGNGEAGIRGGPAGDLYVVIHVKEHEVFEREAENLFCEVPLPFTTAALGGELRVPTLEGQAQLKIPAGTQSGATFKLRSRGMPLLNTSARGDLHVRVAVEVPTKLNVEQRRKLEEFAQLMGDDNTPLHKGFFEKAKEFFS